MEIEGFHDYYASNDGRIFSTKRGSLVELSPYADMKDHYMLIRIIGDDGKRHSLLMHRIVGTAYVPNPLKLPEINHKDNNPKNNRFENLEWCDRRQNLMQSYKTMPSTRNFRTCSLFVGGDHVKDFQSISEAAVYAEALYGVSVSSLIKYRRCGNVVIDVPSDDFKPDPLISYPTRKHRTSTKV